MSVAVGTTTAQSPLAANLAGLKKNVASYVQGASLTSVLGDAGVAINAAIDRLNTRNWNWLLKNQTITFVAATATYQVDARFRRPRKLTKLTTAGKRDGDLSYMLPKDFMDAVFDNSADGSPKYYTVRNASDDRLLELDLAPSSGFVAINPTATLAYYARLLHFADDGATLGDLEAPSEVSQFLVWYGRWELAAARGTASQAEAAERSWMRLWRDLVADDVNEQTDWTARSRYR